ncbi:MAG: 4'-phosphopantetheinyl transferase superfamily protein [Ruminococcaceae bacterium]|nr:4'-phosphopantetheinyl transferase superfamily protein [Oscillospiraceae bacterium]
MKWELNEPKKGDMIRVRAGSIYHYGVYVSDSEVIQFGLAPNARLNVKDCDIEVLSTDIDTFLNGEFLEVAVLDRKETKMRIPPEKTVEAARARIGEKGYNILRNNCEHFANECVMGLKKSSQADDVREFFRNLPIVDVYLGVIPEKVKISSVYPKERAKEIKACSNDRVKREKYCAWKLLEYALNRTFGAKIKELEFIKGENGRWSTPTHHFSISHTDGMVAVSVSRAMVGVDIEKESDKLLSVVPRLLTQDELLEYEKLEQESKLSYLGTKWTQKESIFKSLDEKGFIPHKIEVKEYETYTREIETEGNKYYLSVATQTPERVRLYTNVEYLK